MVLVGILPSFLSRSDTETGRNWKGEPSAIEVSGDLAEDVTDRATDYGPVISLTPYKREGGIEASRRFFRSVHTVRRAGRKGKNNVSTPFSFEIPYWADDKRIGFRYAAADEMTRGDIKDELRSTYHDSDIEMSHEPFLGIEPGQYVSIARLRLRDPNHLKPINSYKSSPEDFRIDPYDGITSKMTGDGYGTDANAMVQITMKPAISHADTRKLCWHYGANELAKNIDDDDMGMRWGSVLESIGSTFTEGADDVEVTKTKYATEEMSASASRVADQAKNLGYHINIRLIAVSDDLDTAKQRVQATARKYSNFYNADYGQGLEPAYPSGGDIMTLLKQSVSREWIDREMPMGIVPLMGVAHPPTYLNTAEAEFTFQRGDEGPPTSAPNFEDFDETGYYNPERDFQESPQSSRSSRSDQSGPPDSPSIGDDLDAMRSNSDSGD